MTPANRARSGSLLLGWLGLILVPTLVSLDSLLAIGQGWEPRTAGAFGKLAYLAIAFLPLSVGALILPGIRRFLRRNTYQMWLLSGSLLLACLVSEMIVRSVRPLPGFHRRPAHTIYRYEPDSYTLPGVFDAAKSTINSEGIRGPELPSEGNPYRILCVGGSTTECYYLDDAEAWPALLMTDLNQAETGRYWVGSVGYSEYASGDHLRFLGRSELLDRVDCIVLLAGVNDFVRLLHGYDMGTADPPLWIRSALVDLVKEVWNVRFQQGFVVDTTGQMLARRRLGSNIPERSIDLDQAAAQFGERITRFLELARSRNIRVVLVSQPVLWDDFLTELGNRRLLLARVYPYAREWEFITPGNCRRAIGLYNETLRQVAEKTGADFVDPAKSIAGIEMYYYDDIHLNERGCQQFAHILAEWFKTHPEAKTN